MGRDGGGGIKRRLSVKILFLCRLSVKIFGLVGFVGKSQLMIKDAG